MHFFLNLFLISYGSGIDIDLFKGINGIALQGGGFEAVFFNWPFFWKLHQYVSVDEIFDSTVTGSCSGGSWFANALIHDKYVASSFDQVESSQWENHLNAYFTALDDVLIDPSRTPTAWEATVRGIMWTAQPIIAPMRLFNDADDLTRNTAAYLVAVDEDPWTRYNHIITKYHSQTPVRDINLHWVVETAILASIINESMAYSFDYEWNFIPAYLEFEIQKRQTSPLQVSLITNKTQLYFEKHSKYDFNKKHWTYDWMQINDMKSAIMKSQMESVQNYAMGSSNAFAQALGTVPQLDNALYQFPTKVKIDDYLFGLADCGLFEEVALIPVISKLQVQGVRQKVLAMKTKRSMEVFFSSSSASWTKPDERIFAGKWDPKTVYDGKSFNVQTQNATTIENPFYSIKAGHMFTLVVVNAKTWNSLFQVTSSRDNDTISNTAREIFADVDILISA